MPPLGFPVQSNERIKFTALQSLASVPALGEASLNRIQPVYSEFKARVVGVIYDHVSETMKYYPNTFLVLNAIKPSFYTRAKDNLCATRLFNKPICVNPAFRMTEHHLNQSLNRAVQRHSNQTKKQLAKVVRTHHLDIRQMRVQHLHQHMLNTAWSELQDGLRTEFFTVKSANPSPPLKLGSTLLWSFASCIACQELRLPGSLAPQDRRHVVFGRLYRPNA